MTRTKNWLLIGTVLPALTLPHGGFAFEPAQPALRLAQAPGPDSDPNQPRRPRPPGPPGGPGGPGEQPQRPGPGEPRPERPPGAERPRPAPGGPGGPGGPGAPPPAIQRPAPPAPAPQPAPQPPRAAPPVERPAQPPVARPPAPPPPGEPSPNRGQSYPAPAPMPAPPPAARPPASPPPAEQAPNRGQSYPAPAPQQAPQAPPPPAPPSPVQRELDKVFPQRQRPSPDQPPIQRPPGGGITQPQPPAPPMPPAPPIQRPPGGERGGPGLRPPVPDQPPPPPDRQGRRGGIGVGGAAAIGLGAGILGGIMATQGADRLDEVRGRREERREGDVTIIREPGRTIIRDDDRAIIRRDETERFRDLGWQGRTERRGDENVTVYERPDGSRIITVTDEDGRLIRRVRRMRDGDEVVIIDNTRRDRPGRRFSDEVVVLPPPALSMPRERYIVDAERADEQLIYETITAPPIAAIPRRYTLDEVRYSPDLRARMRSVDIDTVNFESGSWQVTPDQARRLAVIGASIRQALQRSPNEIFLVEGHTDAVGSDIDNLSLSDRRAQSVAEILTRDFGVPPENLTTQGYGEQYLKVNTPEPLRENRRVTLRRITPLLAGQSQ